jgi:cephalosporin-C deacetylase-like acetyl esterase
MMLRNILIFTLLTLMLYSCGKRPLQKEEVSNAIPCNNIRHYLINEATKITNNALKGINSSEDWEAIRGDRYREMVEMLSLVDVPLEGERSPLNVTKVGTIQQDGFRIEKLYYESLPGLYVPADLYIPDNITEPVPAILYQCGHSRTQKVHYQPHARRFAELGFVCLIVETIQWGEVYGEHWGCYSRGWFNWYSRGYTPAGVETWNGIRGLDLLSELTYVDSEKLGVTGISGGGALTWYIAAIDPRIKAAATVCGNSTMESQICTRTIDGHCDCMMFINTYQRDFHDLGALIAPRPLYIAQADRDGLNTVESSRQVYDSLKNFYSMFNAEDNIEFISTPGGHSYHPNSRKAIFSFFTKHLMGENIPPAEIGDVTDDEEVLLSAEELQVYVDGPPSDDRTTTIQDSFIKIPAPPEINNKDELITHRDKIIQQLKEKTFSAFPEDSIPIEKEMVFRTLDRAAYGSEIFSFNSEEGWRLKIDLRYRKPRDSKRPLMIVLRNPEEQRWDSELFISGLNENWNIAYLEVRGVGEVGWAPELQWHVRRASAWTGRTLASMRIYDLLRTIEFARSLPDVDPGQIGIAARGEMASVALFSALLDGKCKSLLLQNPPATLDAPSNPNGRGEALELLNVLQITDVNQLPALIYPAKSFLLGDVPDTYKWPMDILEKIELSGQVAKIEDMSQVR